MSAKKAKKKAKRRVVRKPTTKATKKKATKRRAKKATKKATKRKATKKRTKKAAAQPGLLPDGTEPRVLLSMRQYAAHRKGLGLPGGTHVAVSKAIDDGRLTTASTNKRGRDWFIDPALADAEWKEATLEGKVRDPERIAAARRAAAAGRDQDLEHLDQPTLFGDMEVPGAGGEQTTPKSASDTATAAKFNRADRFYSAALRKLEYEQKAGLLVEKARVEAELFETFRGLRDHLLGVPNRISAILAAETDEATVRATLQEELRVVLQDTADAIRRR